MRALCGRWDDRGAGWAAGRSATLKPSPGTRPRHRDVVRFLLNDPGFRAAGEISVANSRLPNGLRAAAHAARSSRAGWELPAIESVGDLADWLSLSMDELEWFADLKGLCNKLQRTASCSTTTTSYTAKRSGGVRLIEMPKPRLKEMQRRILSGILDLMPVHAAVHGFVKGRSIVSFAAPHAGKAVVLRLDLQDFFPGFPAARVQALFRTLGYPEGVADRLGGICTNAAGRDVWSARPVEIAAREWQEARTFTHVLTCRKVRRRRRRSPTLRPTASIAAWLGLARTAGAVYTRYADDLAFSGGEEFHRVAERFAAHAAAVALEEGFSVNHHKTRMMRQGVRQQLAGVVVNRKVSLRRRDLELLEAILTNCVRSGPASQNRDALPTSGRTWKGGWASWRWSTGRKGCG